MDRSVFELFRLDGKVAIVTGAHAWLGYDIACAFAEAGADVIITSRNVDSIRETAAQIGEKYHVDTLALPLDQRKYENVQKYIQRNLKEFKEINKQNRIKNEEYKKQIHKEHIKILYTKGYNAKEIAELLVYTHSYMREYISKNLSEYKIEHKKNRVIKKEMIRAVDNMNNSYISNSAILEWNRQSYDYNENGNIVFNEKHGARPLDLPKTFYNTI